MHTLCLRVVVVSGNERQSKATQRLKNSYESESGHRFAIDWLAAGYDPTRRVLATISIALSTADLLLVSPRVGKIIRAHAISEARRNEIEIVQLIGSGTGVSGVVRESGRAVDWFISDRGAA